LKAWLPSPRDFLAAKLLETLVFQLRNYFYPYLSYPFLIISSNLLPSTSATTNPTHTLGSQKVSLIPFCEKLSNISYYVFPEASFLKDTYIPRFYKFPLYKSSCHPGHFSLNRVSSTLSLTVLASKWPSSLIPLKCWFWTSSVSGSLIS
jgi:hypothetical protein